MALIYSNTTCDVYRSGNTPPAAPDVSAVECFLKAGYRAFAEAAEGMGYGLRFTHTMLVGPAVDVRGGDGESLDPTGTNNDTVYVPDRNGTPFTVVDVERVGLGTPLDAKRAYLRRGLPPWPTNEL